MAIDTRAQPTPLGVESDLADDEQPQTEVARPGGKRSSFPALLSVLGVLALLYVFLTSIGMLGAGFKIFGAGFAKALINTTQNPFVGLFIGILATSVVQSSSTTTSMVVAFVASGTLSIPNAVPIIMGANIGTTVTCTLVSLGHMSRKNEFRRALSAATVHDFFNLMTVATLLPLELTTGFLQKSATWLAELLFGSSSFTFSSPVTVATEPVVAAVVGSVAGLSKAVAGTLVAVLGLILLFASLALLTMMLRRLLIERIETFFNKTIGSSGLLGILMGLVITALVQSSSVTTSLLIPMAAAGAISLPQIFPIAIGANIGTTVTAILAALAGNSAGLTIAFTHLLFNVSGALIIYPLPVIRRIPMRLAAGLGNLAARSKLVALAFVLGVFFVAPGLLILVWKLVG